MGAGEGAGRGKPPVSSFVNKQTKLKTNDCLFVYVRHTVAEARLSAEEEAQALTSLRSRSRRSARLSTSSIPMALAPLTPRS